MIGVAFGAGEVITTLVNGKEETRNTAQEGDFVVPLGPKDAEKGIRNPRTARKREKNGNKMPQ